MDFLFIFLFFPLDWHIFPIFPMENHHEYTAKPPQPFWLKPFWLKVAREGFLL